MFVSEMDGILESLAKKISIVTQKNNRIPEIITQPMGQYVSIVGHC